MFPGERLVLPAGRWKVRSYDTDYRFRSDTAHTYFSGNQTSDAVLVIDGSGGEAVLYARPSATRETDEFFRDRQYGELWVGRRPSLREISTSLGIEVRHLDDLRPPSAAPARPECTAASPTPWTAWCPATTRSTRTSPGCISEMRLIKDDWEVAELQYACDITALGFTDSVAEWDRVLEFGERWIEGTFFRRARAQGNDIGYDSIVGGGSHATTLHWIENTGTIDPGELVLLDMGVEGRNLYTADVTRTLPVDGTFTPLQRDLYTLVLRRAGGRHRRGEARASRTTPPTRPRWSCSRTASRTWSCCRAPPRRRSTRSRKVYARWTLHGVSHMLGMDVHDCGQAAPEAYAKGTYAEGMVLTVEPGLYFQADDLLVPEELRGIGIRIEDDMLVTADGTRNLSDSLPRTADDVEAWFAEHRG